MALLLKKEPFTLAPEGTWPAVCVDVQDAGIMHSDLYNKDSHKVRFTWQLAERDPKTGKRFLLTKLYTLSFSEKATLVKDLGLWRGRKYTEADFEQGIDLESLIGQQCQLQIQHGEGSTGKTYANIIAVMRPHPKDDPIRAEDYVRGTAKAPRSADDDPYSGAGVI